MKIRLNKVQKELNLGLNTIVEYLQKKGFEIKEDPNAVVPEEGYNMLIEEFSADKKARIQSDNFTKERQNKEKPKSIAVEEPKKEEPKPAPAVVIETPKAEPEVKVEPKKEEPLIKVTRRIDLDALNRKKVEPKKEEPKPAPVVVAEEPKKEEPAKVEPKSVEPQPQLTKVEEVAPKLNVIGQIDLSALNQSTRP